MITITKGYSGTVKNGVVVFEGGCAFPEGTAVVVLPAETPDREEQEPDWNADPLLDLPAVDLGPPDLAWEHDYYAYGGEKRGNMPKPQGSED